MSTAEVHVCGCPSCQGGEQPLHHEINLFVSRLDEQQRRWFAGLEAKRRGYGGESQVARITGIDPKTIRRGRHELDADLADHPEGRVRATGGGRRPVEQQDPGLEEALVEMLEPETAGKPTAMVLYKRSSLRNLRDRREGGRPQGKPSDGGTPAQEVGLLAESQRQGRGVHQRAPGQARGPVCAHQGAEARAPGGR